MEIAAWFSCSGVDRYLIRALHRLIMRMNLFNPSNMKVMIVDDTAANIEVLRETLRNEGYNLAAANSGEKALQLIPKFKPDLILLDVMMPGLDGFATCAQLKQDPLLREIPVIFITAKVEPADIVRGFKEGAVDYIAKPFNEEEVKARVRNHLMLKFSKDKVDALAREKDKFLGMAAHDLRSPLAAILGFAELLQEEVASLPEPERQRMFTLIINASQEMLEMVNELLDITAISTGTVSVKPERLDLAELAQIHSDQHRFVAAKKSIDIYVHTERRPSVEADRRRLGQVIDNFITNAIKFSQPGTRVTVEVMDEGGFGVLRVCDEGPGLTETDHKKVFSEFQALSAKPTAGETSTGLGLAIVKRIVDAHGGNVFAENRTPRGAVFGVRIPLVAR